jgi:hypothetical protein
MCLPRVPQRIINVFHRRSEREPLHRLAQSAGGLDKPLTRR